MKYCSKCKSHKEFSLFSKNKCHPDGFDNWCKACKKGYKDQYYQKNKDKIIAYANEYHASHPQERKEYLQGYWLENKDKFKLFRDQRHEEHPEIRVAQQSLYYKENKIDIAKEHKVYYEDNKPGFLYRSALRRACKLNATPKWLTAEQMAEIKVIYDTRPEGYHVDHIVPLQGKNVCGLHVPWNLQHLPGTENLSKHNKY